MELVPLSSTAPWGQSATAKVLRSYSIEGIFTRRFLPHACITAGITVGLFMAFSAGSASHQADSKRGSNESILVVDDELSIRELLSAILARAGYCVLTAADACEAATTLAEHFTGIDLIISDISMPGIDGHRLLEHIRRIKPRARCILMSGDAFVAVDEDVPFLRKPFSLDQLLGTVIEALKTS